MAEMFESGITVTFVCAFCGKRESYKTREKNNVRLLAGWNEVKLDFQRQRFYGGATERMLVCSDDHAIKYRTLENEAVKAANGAFREHIRQGQCQARSAVDALAETVREPTDA